MRILDSRRVTGSNLYTRQSGALIDAALDPAVDPDPAALVAAWRRAITRVVPWSAELHARHYRGGVSLFVSGPLDVLMPLTDLNETDHKQGHRRVYTVATLLADIAGAGLAVETHGTFMLKPLSNAQMDGLDRSIADAFFEVGRQLPGWGSSI